MRLGEALSSYRRLRDMTVTTLAGQIGVSPGVITRLERGDEIRSNQLSAVLTWLFQRDPKQSRTAAE